MASPYDDMPDMGMDYGTLLRLSKPDPLRPGASGAEAWMNGWRRGEYRNKLDKAAGMADIDARMRTQRAEEYSAGAPGRRAKIEYENRKHAGFLSQVPDELGVRQSEFEGKRAKSRAERFKEDKEKLSEYAPRWRATPSTEGKRLLLDEMSSKGLTIGDKDLRTVPIERVDEWFNAAFQGDYDDPKLRSDREKAKYTVDARERTAAENRAALMERERFKAEQKVSFEKIKKEMEAQKPETLNVWKAKMYEKMRKGEMTDEDQAAFNKLIADESFVQAQRIANQPPQVDPTKLPGGLLTKPPGPTIPPIPPQKNKPKEKVDMSKMKMGVDIIGENGKGHFQLKDGRIVDKEGNVIE